MANQHAAAPHKITLPPFPDMTFGPAAQPAPRKTPLEAYQESRIPARPPEVAEPKPRPEPSRATIDPAPILKMLRKGPMTAAAIAKAIGFPTERVSTTLRNCRKQGQVVGEHEKSKRHSMLWALPGKGAE